MCVLVCDRALWRPGLRNVSVTLEITTRQGPFIATRGIYSRYNGKTCGSVPNAGKTGNNTDGSVSHERVNALVPRGGYRSGLELCSDGVFLAC